MAIKTPPYCAWRAGRPRFAPGPRERQLGFVPQDLLHEDGRWFSYEEARAFCEDKQQAIQAARRKPRSRLANAVAAPRGQSVQDLLMDFLKSGKMTRPREERGFSDKTKADYREKINALMYQPVPRASRKSAAEYMRRSRERARAGGAIGDAVANGAKKIPSACQDRELEPFMLLPARAITPHAISNDEEGGLYEYLVRARGPSMARGCIMVLSTVYKWGRKAKAWKLAHNPCTQLGIPKLKPQGKPWPIEALRAAMAFADHPQAGPPEIGDAILLALLAMQREDDLLNVTSAHVVDVEEEDEHGNAYVLKKVRMVQSKRNRAIEVPFVDMLLARLTAMADRREQKKWTCDELLVNPATGKGWNQNTFQHEFRAFRAAVAAGRPDLGLPPCPAISTLTFQKLRNTGLTWLRKAKADDDEFMAVSGHARASLPQVMPHYYTPGADEAVAAMTKLSAWMQRRGIKL
jgi:hypothetical protein